MVSGKSHVVDGSVNGTANQPINESACGYVNGQANESTEGSTDRPVWSDNIFRYLSLPQEIRQMIYEESFNVSDPTYKWLDTPLPGILFVSRKIRQEALEVFYKQSRFIIDLDDRVISTSRRNSAPADPFLNLMTRHLTRQLSRMRKLRLRIWLHGQMTGMHATFDIDLQIKPVTKIRLHTFVLERNSNILQVLAWESMDNCYKEESLARLQRGYWN